MSGKGAKGLLTGKTPASKDKDKDKKKPTSRSSRAGLQVFFFFFFQRSLWVLPLLLSSPSCLGFVSIIFFVNCQLVVLWACKWCLVFFSACFLGFWNIYIYIFFLCYLGSWAGWLGFYAGFSSVGFLPCSSLNRVDELIMHSAWMIIFLIRLWWFLYRCVCRLN